MTSCYHDLKHANYSQVFCEPFEVVNGETILIEYSDAVVLDAYGPRSTLEFDECDVPGFVQNYIKNVRIERVNY